MKVLIVVDYQNDFVNGALGFESAKNSDKEISQKIRNYLNQIPNGKDKELSFVFMTLDTHFKDYLLTEEGKNLPIKHCMIDSEGHNLYGETALIVDDYIKQYMNEDKGFNPDCVYDDKNKLNVKNYNRLFMIEKSTFGSDLLLEELKKINDVIVTDENEIYNKITNSIGLNIPYPNHELIIDDIEKYNEETNNFNIFLKEHIKHIDEIEICGLVSNMCVIANAVIAKTACPNAHIVILKDLCDSFDKELNEKSFDIMKSLQMEIR